MAAVQYHFQFVNLLYDVVWYLSICYTGLRLFVKRPHRYSMVLFVSPNIMEAKRYLGGKRGIERVLPCVFLLNRVSCAEKSVKVKRDMREEFTSIAIVALYKCYNHCRR